MLCKQVLGSIVFICIIFYYYIVTYFFQISLIGRSLGCRTCEYWVPTVLGAQWIFGFSSVLLKQFFSNIKLIHDQCAQSENRDVFWNEMKSPVALYPSYRRECLSTFTHIFIVSYLYVIYIKFLSYILFSWNHAIWQLYNVSF